MGSSLIQNSVTHAPRSPVGREFRMVVAHSCSALPAALRALL